MAHSPMVDALLCSSAYSARPETINLVQTHISNVFLTPEFVYKVKKPVDFGFLDFSTLEKRRFFCLEEVRLNSRLAPDIYLGVVPIFRVSDRVGGRVGGGDGEVFKVGDDFIDKTGDGEGAEAIEDGLVIADYAVKMRRIEADTILDEMIRQDRASQDILRRVARAIAAFHKKAETIQPGTDQPDAACGKGPVDTIAHNIMDNFTQIEPFIGDTSGATISRRRLTELREFSASFIANNRDLLEARVSGGFIRDCHGDIHVDHVVVADAISIFDCIEFSERLRICDIVADAGFLSMDLEYLGRGDLAEVFEAEYKKASGDVAPEELWNLYKCYRAVVRGKVASLKSGGADIDEEERRTAIADAIEHFHIAELYAKGGFRPSLVIVSGLTATGKSTLVRAIKGTGSMKVISTDATRRKIFNIAEGEHRRGEFGKDIYTEDSVAKVYEAALKEAADWLRLGRSVILDATFSKKKYLQDARAIADNNNALCYVIECVASDESVKARMAERLKERNSLSDATYETYQEMKKSFEPIEGECLRINTDGELNEITELAIRKVFGGSS